ncbi:D-alanyl-D-alanine dipeptidase [Corallococcus sp. H22C18031201]|uniref:D-alanyl-D-alanine dipeptidase n=1 Tax=Citreicoccus inhibens TaxID=2849499 RepID=UPI000E72D1A6|nr:D-alanyl-D-alanine dipeptidase [Citreicoccus inhibens]MBU8895492.1 D-alanyl-D-alanine dipeptidase [Citreicoccus inhibens]RJS22479.1 D-alanyl-D-alanine dipeptidase [Corallococcus sp. H22C18031201]
MRAASGWLVVAGLSLGSGALAQAPQRAASPPAPDASIAPLVDATTVVEDLVLDLRYATPDNFLNRKVYPDGARCLLLPDAARRLKQAADALRPKGYRLKVYDCYRPRAVQWEMWKIMPKPGYVADPRKGSNHNRGAAVDLTLVTREGGEVEMPTPFDSFSPAAHQGYTGGTPASRAHRAILLEAMTGTGFTPNKMEWWHFDLPGATKLPVQDVPFTSPKP